MSIEVLALALPIAFGFIQFLISRRSTRVQSSEASERISAASARYVEMTEKHIQSLDAKLDVLEIRNNQLEETVNALRNENEVLQGRLNNIDQLYSELGLRLQSEMTLRRHLESENTKLQARVTELETEVKDLRRQLGMA